MDAIIVRKLAVVVCRTVKRLVRIADIMTDIAHRLWYLGVPPHDLCGEGFNEPLRYPRIYAVSLHPFPAVELNQRIQTSRHMMKIGIVVDVDEMPGGLAIE